MITAAAKKLGRFASAFQTPAAPRSERLSRIIVVVLGILAVVAFLWMHLHMFPPEPSAGYCIRCFASISSSWWLFSPSPCIFGGPPPKKKSLSDVCYIFLTTKSAYTQVPRGNRRRILPWVPHLQPGFVAVTTTVATAPSASFLPARPSPALRDRCVMFSDIAQGGIFREKFGYPPPRTPLVLTWPAPARARARKSHRLERDEHVNNVRVRPLQCDEIWSFVGAKAKNVTLEQKAQGWGDTWTWTGICG